MSSPESLVCLYDSLRRTQEIDTPPRLGARAGQVGYLPRFGRAIFLTRLQPRLNLAQMARQVAQVVSCLGWN